MVCSATAGTKTALGIIQLWFNYLAASFFKTRGNEMLILWKFPKSIAGRMKGPRRPHATRGAACLRPLVRQSANYLGHLIINLPQKFFFYPP